MPRIEYRPRHYRFLTLLCRILLVLVLTLALVIAGGTLYALVFRPQSAPAPVPEPQVFPETAIFTGLGRLRCSTAEPGAALMIVQPSFPYFPGDRPFSEELTLRLRDFRSQTAAYFAGLTAEELRRKGETEVKEDLLARYNALLRLGRIETLYFNEYMLIE